MFEMIQPYDFAVLDFIREHLTCGFLDNLLYIFTTLGNAGAVWIAVTIGLLISKKHRGLGVMLAIGLILMLLTGNILLKNLIARPRPFMVNTDIILAISPPSGFSFPSGHSFSSGAAAAITSLYSKKLAAITIPAAFLIAFSRLYFYVHFPSDVLCGLLFGITLGAAVYFFCRKKIPICRKPENSVQ